MIQGYLQLQELPQQHNEMHRKLHLFGMALLPTKFSAAPTLDELPVRYCAIYESGATRRLYMNIDGVLTYMALTNA
jgi:hypothetical protein